MGNITRLKRGAKLLIATHNAGKLAEFRELFSPLGIVLISAKDLDLPEPEETGTTFAQNARLKAHAAAGATGRIPPVRLDRSDLSGSTEPYSVVRCRIDRPAVAAHSVSCCTVAAEPC